MNKEELYAQIQEFNSQLTNPYDKSSKNYQQAYLYVNDENAIDKAQFIAFLIDSGYMASSYETILDLAFGSGNLVSHIVFDNNIDYQNIILNDKNEVRTNQGIVEYIDGSEIWQEDMLNQENFIDLNADLVVVNPQIGGNYIDGDILRQKEEDETQQELLDRFGITLNSFIENGSTLIYYGKEKDFKSILPNKKYIKYKSKLTDVFVVNEAFEESMCFEKDGMDFIQCVDSETDDEEIESFDDIENIVDEHKTDTNEATENRKAIFDSTALGNLEFQYKNILFKGVPGTGKSRAIDKIIDEKLHIKDKKENILRINIHSASSNADLMQGIGITTNGNNVIYKEKQGLIYDIIRRAIFHPNQPFVLILEEIQENSLNELIGDLIYLIEEEKRAKLSAYADDEAYSYQELIETVVSNDNTTHYVEIPFLVSSSTEYRKMILPDNLYIFCTSNYRDDKKVIEDNLLRRFEVIEIYPDKDVVSEYSRDFFESLNKAILNKFEDEIHPDRYMIGHAVWKDVADDKSFYRSLLKVVTEFKDIKEIEFETFSNIMKSVSLPEEIDHEILNTKSYYELIDMLQKKIGYDFTS